MEAKRRRWTVAAGLVAAFLALGACGGDGGSGDDAGAEGSPVPSGPAIDITGKEFSFTPDVVTLEAGRPTTINFENTGSIEHDITVGEIDFQLTVAAGERASRVITMPEPGTYEFICSLPGHRSAGMKGKLEVG